MTQIIVNLTLPVVTAKINRALNALALPSEEGTALATELQEKLVAYVIRRLPVVYVTMEPAAASSVNSCATKCYSAEQQAHIDQLIDQGLQALLLDPVLGEMATVVEALDPSETASSWFG
ncbi:MAG: hypothetical protein KGQ93_03510 [Cyanobacteria bacterium REEB459]|nr:hypothetical protein [Cyanobacteria bacterium REEB459]